MKFVASFRGVSFLWGGGPLTHFVLQTCFCWGQIRLHPQFHLPILSASTLKVKGGGCGGG